MVAIVDYGAGNLRSVENAVKFLGFGARITADAAGLENAEKVIFPGVGEFGSAMANLKKSKLDSAIKKFISEGKPFLGICLGMQLLLDASEESKGAAGLGVFKGKNVRFPQGQKAGLKVPQIGWNRVMPILGNGDAKKLFRGVEKGGYAYFVHSYYAKPADGKAVAADTEYGIRFASALAQGNVFAMQFHPERSGQFGLRVLKNFLEI